MLIRSHQALPLARNNSKLLIFNNISKIYGIQVSLSDLYEEIENNPYIFFLFQICSMPLYFTRYSGSKLALLNRVKERKTPSLSAQASFAPFSRKVVWSGKSLIVEYCLVLGSVRQPSGPSPHMPGVWLCYSYINVAIIVVLHLHRYANDI